MGGPGVSTGLTLFTIRGLKARLLKVLIGTPLLLLGVAFAAVGLGSGGGTDALVPIGLGAAFGFAGLYSYYGAIRNDEFSVTISARAGRGEGGGS